MCMPERERERETTRGLRKLTSSDETNRNPRRGESCGMKRKWVFFIHHSLTLKRQRFNVAKNCTSFMPGNETMSDSTSCITPLETKPLWQIIFLKLEPVVKMVNWDTLSEISHVWGSQPFVSCLPPPKMSVLYHRFSSPHAPFPSSFSKSVLFEASLPTAAYNNLSLP